MSNKSPKTRLQGRDARNGQFVPLSETKRRPSTTVRERVPNPGHGDTGRAKK
ncbi:MAG: hypothetical protein ACF8R9_12810 [Phycisphaerales bacterium JB054]